MTHFWPKSEISGQIRGLLGSGRVGQNTEGNPCRITSCGNNREEIIAGGPGSKRKNSERKRVHLGQLLKINVKLGIDRKLC